MDGDQVLAEYVLIDLNNIDLTKENHLLEGIYTDAECTKAFGNENVSDILLHGADNLCLYTKWIETNSGDEKPAEEQKTIFTDSTIQNGGYGTAEIIDEDGIKVAHVIAGDWMSAVLTLPQPIDISNKKIKVTAKVSSDYDQGICLFKLVFVTDDTHQSEVTANEDGNVGWCNLTTEYAEYIASDLWIAYQIDEGADLTNITKIIINPQSGTGDIWIKNIEFVD